MSLPQITIADLRPDQLSLVAITHDKTAWRLPTGAIFGADFRQKSTLLSVPDWGFSLLSRDDDHPALGGAVSTTSFARQAGTLVATQPIPDANDLDAQAARLVSDLQGGFGAPGQQCRADLLDLGRALVYRILPDAETPGAFLSLPTVPSKPAFLRSGLLPGGSLRLDAKIPLRLAGTARVIENGQAKPFREIFITLTTSAHARMETMRRLAEIEARLGISLTDWLAAAGAP